MMRLKFTIAFLCTILAGFIFLHLDAEFESTIQALIGSIGFISCVGYTLTGIALWFTGLDNYLLRE